MKAALVVVGLCLVALVLADERTVGVGYFLKDAVAKGAVCLDGSAPLYYFRPGIGDGVNKWYIHHMGGGWCDSPENCAERAKTFLGSTTTYAPTNVMNETYFSPNAELNPLMWNWNAVLLIYCDGGSFTGNRADPIQSGKQTLYYRGALVREAIKDDLIAKHNFGALTDLVVSGCSAGGLSTYLHADWWRQQVSPNARVVGLPDSGFFLDWPSPSNVSHSYNFAMQYVYSAMNPTLHPKCVSGNPQNPGKCLFAEHISPYIATPIFSLQPRFDTWQIDNVLGSRDPARINEFGDVVTQRLKKASLSNQQNGAFLDSCAHHCGGYNSITIRGHSAAYAFFLWYQKKATDRLWYQPDPFPCDKCCA